MTIAAQDRIVMGTFQDAEEKLAALAIKWRELRQPSIAVAKKHKDREAHEREIRFQLANAALLWLWHRENAVIEPPYMPTLDEALRFIKSNPKTSADALRELSANTL